MTSCESSNFEVLERIETPRASCLPPGICCQCRSSWCKVWDMTHVRWLAAWDQKVKAVFIRHLAAMDLNSFRGFGNEGPNTPHHCQISVACQQIKTFDSKELFISELKRQEEEDLIVWSRLWYEYSTAKSRPNQQYYGLGGRNMLTIQTVTPFNSGLIYLIQTQFTHTLPLGLQ